jgi:hypothetical protein
MATTNLSNLYEYFYQLGGGTSPSSSVSSSASTYSGTTEQDAKQYAQQYAQRQAQQAQQWQGYYYGQQPQPVPLPPARTENLGRYVNNKFEPKRKPAKDMQVEDVVGEEIKKLQGIF